MHAVCRQLFTLSRKFPESWRRDWRLSVFTCEIYTYVSTGVILPVHFNVVAYSTSLQYLN